MRPTYAERVDIALASLFVFALPFLVGFLLVYWAVRLAIRHEKGRERRG